MQYRSWWHTWYSTVPKGCKLLTLQERHIWDVFLVYNNNSDLCCRPFLALMPSATYFQGQEWPRAPSAWYSILKGNVESTEPSNKETQAYQMIIVVGQKHSPKGVNQVHKLHIRINSPKGAKCAGCTSYKRTPQRVQTESVENRFHN